MVESPAEERVDQGRRTFLKVSAAAGGGLLIGFHVPLFLRQSHAATTIAGFAPNAWIHIAPDDRVTLQVASSEMGQGVMTAIPMLLAEELDCDWTKVRVENAPAHSDYANPIFGVQATGGRRVPRDASCWSPPRHRPGA